MFQDYQVAEDEAVERYEETDVHQAVIRVGSGYDVVVDNEADVNAVYSTAEGI